MKKTNQEYNKLSLREKAIVAVLGAARSSMAKAFALSFNFEENPSESTIQIDGNTVRIGSGICTEPQFLGAEIVSRLSATKFYQTVTEHLPSGNSQADVFRRGLALSYRPEYIKNTARSVLKQKIPAMPSNPHERFLIILLISLFVENSQNIPMVCESVNHLPEHLAMAILMLAIKLNFGIVCAGPQKNDGKTDYGGYIYPFVKKHKTLLQAHGIRIKESYGF